MTDESDLLRRVIETEVERQIEKLRPGNQPPDARRLAQVIAEEVLYQLRRFGAQVVRIHATGRQTSDG